VVVSDSDTHDPIGGLIGRTSLGLCFIDPVFLPDRMRGHDVGRAMMQRAKEEAGRRRCRAIVLYTISFQAPGFCEKLRLPALGDDRLRSDGHEPDLLREGDLLGGERGGRRPSAGGVALNSFSD